MMNSNNRSVGRRWAWRIIRFECLLHGRHHNPFPSSTGNAGSREVLLAIFNYKFWFIKFREWNQATNHALLERIQAGNTAAAVHVGNENAPNNEKLVFHEEELGRVSTDVMKLVSVLALTAKNLFRAQ